tara:strand:- start:110 stop:295 length:186 start_codon:yes stop_codon:yes gene_type:complete
MKQMFLALGGCPAVASWGKYLQDNSCCFNSLDFRGERVNIVYPFFENSQSVICFVGMLGFF